MPADKLATCSAAVPEFTAIACLHPANSAKAFSNSATFGPCAIIPDFMTSMTALISSSPIIGLAIETLMSAIFSPNE